jgi:nucleotide-binding universal stress UspA family protein
LFDKILAAHDGSEGGPRAFDFAADLAGRTNAGLHPISVEEDLPRHASYSPSKRAANRRTSLEG